MREDGGKGEPLFLFFYYTSKYGLKKREKN